MTSPHACGARIGNNPTDVGKGAMTMKLDGTKSPWPSQAHDEVSGLRPAITAQLDEPMVASSMAPMMGELLARLEGFSTPRDVAQMPPPKQPSGEAPMTPAGASEALHDACGALREQVLSMGADPQRATTLQSMVEVIEDHLAMKGEIIARSTNGPER